MTHIEFFEDASVHIKNTDQSKEFSICNVYYQLLLQIAYFQYMQAGICYSTF